MGRFTSGGGAVPRKQTIRLTASNPSVPIPSWARIAYITGTAPGGGGANSTTAGTRGGGGGAGGYVIRLPLQITNETSLAVTIGAAGTGAAANSNGAGANGGDTTIVMGTQTVTLEGGRGAFAGTAGGGTGGRSIVGVFTGILTVLSQPPFSGSMGQSVAMPLGMGGTGGNSSASPQQGQGAGGVSPFGSPGPGVDTVTNNTAGGNAAGFGAGGAGGQGTGKGGDGAPSFILIEFEEATTA